MNKAADVVKCFLYLFSLLAIALPVRGASFDCAKATARVDKIICGDATLSALDDELSSTYQKVLSKYDVEQKQLLRMDQRHWLKAILNLCPNEECIKLAYQSRIRELATNTPLAEPTNLVDMRKEMPGPWLRLYSEGVASISLDAGQFQPDKPISIESLNVQIYNADSLNLDTPIYADAMIVPHPHESYEMRIESFLTGKSWPEGCLYFHVNSKLEQEPSAVEIRSCKELRQKAVLKFSNEIEACSKNNLRNSFRPQFFIDANLGYSVCLLLPNTTQWRDRLAQSNHWVTREMKINSGIKYGVRAYLNLDNNFLFGCGNYGSPVRYWSKESSVHESWTEFSFYKEKPVWQKQYLIKTDGFRYRCWNAWRILDEPEAISIRLGDGTVLLRGNRSILRVREKDGSTEASAKQVKVFDPVFVRQVLDEHGAQKCNGDYLAAGECPMASALGWQWKPGIWKDTNAEANFNRLVIQGVDSVLQDLFDVSH